MNDDRAVNLKKIEGPPAKTTDRVTEISEKVSATATQHGLDPELARKLWSELIVCSIQMEIRELEEQCHSEIPKSLFLIWRWKS